MKPGRELDALIADKVMAPFDDKSPEGIAARLNGLNIAFSGGSFPPYSTDIAAAWLVVEKLQSLDWALILDNMQDYLGNWQAHFEKDRAVETAESESAPHAICLAALKVINSNSK